MPKIIGIMTVRDEDDVLEEALVYAAGVYDTVFCLDCGSVDGSAEIIERIAANYSNVFFLGRLPAMTSMQVKRHVWSEFRREYGHDDWWCFADADEFADKSIQEIVSYATTSFFDHIDSEHINFYYTNLEYAKWVSGEEDLASRNVSIRERRKFYRLHTTQVRLFRNLPWLRWNTDSPLPSFLSAPADRRVRFLHYQYRDVPQIERRIAVRAAEYHRSDPTNTHWLKSSLQDAISQADDGQLRLFDGGPFIVDPSLPPPRSQPAPKRMLKYARNIVRGITTSRTEQGLAALFTDRSASTARRGTVG